MPRVAFRWSEEFVGRIDAARGLVSRSAWLRALVERELGDPVRGLEQASGGVTKGAVSGVLSESHSGPTPVRDPVGEPVLRPHLIPGLLRASELVEPALPEPDADPFAEDEWPPREARDW
jgi:hypothetical protein